MSQQCLLNLSQLQDEIEPLKNRPHWIMFWPQRFDEIVSNLTCHRFAFLKTAPGIWNTYTILHHMKAYDYCVEKQSLKFQTLSGGGAEKPNIRIGAWLFNFSYQIFISYQNYCRFDKNSTLYSSINFKKFLQAANSFNVFLSCPDWICFSIMKSENHIWGL